MGDGRQDPVGIRDWGQRNECDTLCEVILQCHGYRNGDPRLTDATRPKQSDQLHVGLLEYLLNGGNFASPADQGVQRPGDRGRRWLFGSDERKEGRTGLSRPDPLRRRPSCVISPAVRPPLQAELVQRYQ